MLRFKKLFTGITQCNAQNRERIKGSAFPFPLKSLGRMEARWGQCVKWPGTRFSETEDILTEISTGTCWALSSFTSLASRLWLSVKLRLLGESKPRLSATWMNCCPMICQDPKPSKAIASSHPLAGDCLQTWCPIDSFWDCGITFCNLALSFNTWDLQH